MKTALVLLTLALAVGVALAPTAAASCPPTTLTYCGHVTPLGSWVGCQIDSAGNYIAEAARDCL